MKALTLLIILSLVSLNLRAQIAISNDNIHGTPVNGVRYQNVKGTPYFSDDWAPARVTLSNGKILESIEIKYDQISEQLIFKGKEDQVYTFEVPVSAFSIRSRTAEGSMVQFNFRNGYPAIDKNGPLSFYQVLVDGEVQLLKRRHKGIVDTRPYGYLNTVRTITESESYYLKSGDTFLRLKRDRNSILKRFKPAEFDEFIKENKLNLSTEADLIRAVTYLNAK